MKILSLGFFVLLTLILGHSGAALATERKTPIAPEEFLKMKNPVALSPEVLQEAADMYKDKCVKCHGANGNGKGSATKGLDVKPRDYTDKTLMVKIPDGQLCWIILNGSDLDTTDMEGYKKKFTEDQVWKLVHYIRSFAP
ncbi:MAG: c-type cytochrome [Nitrospira sp.]|nr:MAG: c-type cytochrome [Nitrospira sp.]